MRNILKYLYLALLTACGHDPRLGASIEAPFLPHVAEFERACGCKVIDIPITFQKIDDANAGECWDYSYPFEGFQEIMIDREWWYEANPREQEQLIFHELGHCRLHRQHTESMQGAFPISLMYPKMGRIPNWFYVQNRSQYFDELFQRNNFEVAYRTRGSIQK